MKRLLLVLVALLPACAKSCQRTAPPQATQFVAASIANLREKPADDAAIVGKLAIGDEVQIAETQGEWRRVTAPKAGWLKSELLADEKPTVESLLAKHDAASDRQEKRTFAERAAALDPRSLPALERLYLALTIAEDPEADRVKARMAGLKSEHLAASADGSFVLKNQQPPGDLYTVHDLEVSPGRVWVATNAGILSWERAKNEWTAVWGADGTLPREVYQLASDPPSLWAATGSGLFRLDLDAKRWKIVTGTNGQPLVASSVAVGPDSVWVGDPVSPVIVEMSRAGKVVRRVDTGLDGVRRLATDGSRVWALGTIPTPTPEPTPAFEDDPATEYDESEDHYDYGYDQRELMLVITSGGAAATVTTGPNFYGATDLASDDRFLYVVLGNGFVARVDKRTMEVDQLPQQAVAIARDRGLLWVGASYDVSGASDFVLRYIEDAATEWKDAFVVSGQISSILSLANGELWLGTRWGIVRWQKRTKKATRFVPQDGDPLTMQAEEVTLEGEPPRIGY